MILSYKDINNIASNIISNYYGGFCDERFTVDIVDLLDKMYNIKVGYFNLSKSKRILGMTSNYETTVKVWNDDIPLYIDIDKNIVLVEKDLLSPKQEGRRNFTIAHEGAHQILFRLEDEINQIHLRNPQSQKKHILTTDEEWNEWQANTLASCLLMPEQKVKEVFFMFYKTEYIEFLNPYNTKLFVPFIAMASFFTVSKQALAIRLKQLSLIGDFQLTKSLDIYKEAI